MTRKNRPKFKRPTKVKLKKVDPSKMNDGGFYEGMPGAHIDQYGSRKFITFVVRPDGQATCMIHADNQLIKLCIQEAMQGNIMTRQIVYGAVVDSIFAKKTTWNWILRMAYKRWFKKRQLRSEQMRRPKPIKLDQSTS